MPTFGTAARYFTGVTMDRTVFRELLPTHRWLVYAAGWVKSGDANTATVSIFYQKDDETLISLGSGTYTGASWQKFAIGPFDVFDTAGVPTSENVAVLRLGGQKNAGVDGMFDVVTMWVRLVPREQ